MTRRLSQTSFVFLCLFLLAVSVAACTPAPKKSVGYTGDAGSSLMLDSDRESCTRSCNAEMDRCLGTTAAQTPVGRDGQMTGVFGAQADCNAAMKTCLARCRTR